MNGYFPEEEISFVRECFIFPGAKWASEIRLIQIKRDWLVASIPGKSSLIYSFPVRFSNIQRLIFFLLPFFSRFSFVFLLLKHAPPLILA